MTYLLMFGWPWFTGAVALGALVGFLTFSRAKGASFSGGWIALLGASALATGYAASFAEILDGREATTLDIAVLAGLAYAAGLPLGGWLKSSAPEAEKKRPAPAPIIVAPAASLAAEPPAFPLEEAALLSPEPVALGVAPLVFEAAPLVLDAAQPGVGVLANGHARQEKPSVALLLEAAEPANVESAPAPAPALSQGRPKKPAPGLRPQPLAGPRDGGPDDLARIKGIGPKSLEKLNGLGVFHYDQIAAWSLDNARWVGAAIGAPGRVERDKWIEQARALAAAGMGQ
jgi:predicted flap endonuclease-1-like 5' DNA nuclease